MGSKLSSVNHALALLQAGETQESVNQMLHAAKLGDAEAFYQLGLWHVYGYPLARDFKVARVLFQKAASCGHQPSLFIHILFIAIGAGGPADWSAARRMMEQAARHDSIAEAQCHFLDGMHLNHDGTPSQTFTLTAVSESPAIFLSPSLISLGEAQHIIKLASPNLTQSVVADPHTGDMRPDPIRTSDGTVLGPLQMDLVIHAINQRIAHLTGTRESQGEPLSVLRYQPDQEYRLHHDCLPGERNQRCLTAIAYLNDGYCGGQTHFPAANANIRGKTGDVIIFKNTQQDGSPDLLSRHAGLPVSSGEKWIATRWIRSSDFDPWSMRS